MPNKALLSPLSWLGRLTLRSSRLKALSNQGVRFFVFLEFKLDQRTCPHYPHCPSKASILIAKPGILS